MHCDSHICKTKRPLLTGLLLIAAGLALLAHKLGYIDSLHAWLVAPAAIAIGGVIELLEFNLTGLLKGCANLMLAGWLYALLAHIPGWEGHTSWPILLMVAGLNVIAHAFAKKQTQA